MLQPRGWQRLCDARNDPAAGRSCSGSEAVPGPCREVGNSPFLCLHPAPMGCCGCTPRPRPLLHQHRVNLPSAVSSSEGMKQTPSSPLHEALPSVAVSASVSSCVALMWVPAVAWGQRTEQDVTHGLPPCLPSPSMVLYPSASAQVPFVPPWVPGQTSATWHHCSCQGQKRSQTLPLAPGFGPCPAAPSPCPSGAGSLPCGCSLPLFGV